MLSKMLPDALGWTPYVITTVLVGLLGGYLSLSLAPISFFCCRPCLVGLGECVVSLCAIACTCMRTVECPDTRAGSQTN